MTTEAEVRTIVLEVLSKKFASSGFSGVDVVLEKDFDGEDIIRVIAKFSEPAKNSEALFEAASDIRRKLIQRGDERFVFVRQNYPHRSRGELDEDAEGLRVS